MVLKPENPRNDYIPRAHRLGKYITFRFESTPTIKFGTVFILDIVHNDPTIKLYRDNNYFALKVVATVEIFACYTCLRPVFRLACRKYVVLSAIPKEK
jgi:hypothetical protein